MRIDLTKNDIIILDSCSNKKKHGISYHLIINNVIFENNEIQKKYIKYFVNKINDNDIVKSLIGDFIDDSIYKNNQPMRLVNQSKADKLIVLKNINDVNIYDTFICSHNNDNNFIKSDDIECLTIDSIKQKPKKQNIPKSDKLPKIDISQNKINLKIIKNVSDEDFVKLPRWKQYLYLISQPTKNWNIYFKVACALANCEGSTVEDFKEWAALHDDYNENDEVIKNFETRRNKKGYKLGTLRYLAHDDEPEYFKNNFYEIIPILDELNFQGYNVIYDDKKFLNPKYVKLLEKFIYLWADMGRGKTVWITLFILHKMNIE